MNQMVAGGLLPIAIRGVANRRLAAVTRDTWGA
jgi:hypothetical protein